ncbi:MAG TPA: MarR family transcriptional regulator [Terriglobia bacterium]|nr:MarR family transcriptional regulator [Terriglobia bacterium]
MPRDKSSRSPSAENMNYGRVLGQELSTAIVLFHEAVASRLGMNAAEWRCLGLLDLHGPTTAGGLAKLTGYTTGAITGVVDRLEKAGYARREPHPKDRRSVIIHPLRLPELRRQVGPIFASLGQAMTEAASHYTPQEQAAIGTYLERTIQVLRGETAKLSKQRRVTRGRKG